MLVTTQTRRDFLSYALVASGVVLFPLPFASRAWAACPDACLIAWTEPTTNTDGTALLDLLGYHVYDGTVQILDTPAPSAAPSPNSELQVSLPPLATGDHSVTVRAYKAGAESAGSAPLVIQIPPPSSDVTPPTIVFGTPAVLSSGKLLVPITVTDVGLVASVTVRVNGAIARQILSGSGASPVDASVSLPRGTQRRNTLVDVQATDLAGNTAAGQLMVPAAP